MSQLHQPKELLQYRKPLEISTGEQTAAQFAGQVVAVGGNFQLPAAKSVARESCMFTATDDDGTVTAQDGAKIFVNGKDMSSGFKLSSTFGPVILRSDGLRFIGERLGAPPPHGGEAFTLAASTVVYSFNADGESGDTTLDEAQTMTLDAWISTINTSMNNEGGAFYFTGSFGINLAVVLNGANYATVEVNFNRDLAHALGLQMHYTVSGTGAVQSYSSARNPPV